MFNINNLTQENVELILAALACYPEYERKIGFKNFSDDELPEEVKNRTEECKELFIKINSVLPESY